MSASPAGGTVHVAVGAANGRARLAVEDVGPGIRPEDLPRLIGPALRPFLERRRRSHGVVEIEMDPLTN